MRVLVLDEEVERRVENGAVGGGRRHQTGRDERPVAHDVAPNMEVADERAHADADREQEEDRLEKTRQEHVPHALIRENVSLDETPRAARPERRNNTEGRHRRLLVHECSLRLKRRMPHHAPAAVHPTSTKMCTTTAPRWACPVVAARANSTPCHNGESAAIGRKPAGSWLIGKNVPENKNNGSTPRRMIIG